MTLFDDKRVTARAPCHQVDLTHRFPGFFFFVRLFRRATRTRHIREAHRYRHQTGECIFFDYIYTVIHDSEVDVLLMNDEYS